MENSNDINVEVNEGGDGNEGDGSNHGDVGNDGDQANVGEDVDVEDENDNTLEPKKRKKTSKVWEEFKEIILPDGQKKWECFHCKKKLSIGNTGATTQFRRHLERCGVRMHALKKQNILHFQTVDNVSASTGPFSQKGSILGTFKYDKNKIRELIAHYILINEKPFSIVEEFGFNLVLKAMSPYFTKCSRATARNDVMAVYEKEKKKLKNLLKNISRISFTTDLWKSKNQRISYMVVTASNLFLSQICMIKKVLDDGAISLNFFIKEMTTKMKAKFDKYWGECNLLMAFGAVMDPRMKFVVIDFAYPLIYSGDDSLRNVSLVRRQLYKLYEEYVLCYEPEIEGAGDTFRVGTSSVNIARDIQSNEAKKYSGWHDFTAYVTEKTTKRLTKSDLDNYLDDGLELCPDGQVFDVIAWWKNNHTKYRILSRMVVDILSIPVSTVASESTFSAGERVVDTYRSKLNVESIQALICGSNWVRCHYGLKGRFKEEDDDEEVEISFPIS